MARRTLLGTKNNLSSRTRVYLAGDALEVDEIEGYSGVRSRVLLDEVRLITIDRRRSTSVLVWVGLAALAVFAVGAMSFSSPSRNGHDLIYRISSVIAGGGIVSFPLWIIFGIHAFFGVDYVTIFGKRANAAMTFTFRKAKARRTFNELREKVAQAQEEARARFAAEAALALPAPDFGGQTG